MTETFKFDEAKVNAKLAKLDEVVKAFAGKPNYNPYVWASSTIQPLVDKFAKGDRTEALQTAILAVPETPPVIDPNWKPEEKPRVIPVLEPRGLTLPKH